MALQWKRHIVEGGGLYRFRILALLLGLSVVTYLDRVNISVAAQRIMPEYGLDAITMGYVFSAFTLGYALFQIPGGWLADRFGPRRILSLAVLAWSVFTAATAVAGDSPLVAALGVAGALVLTRVLIGIGEAAAYPAYSRVIADWFPPRERALGLGVTIAGVGLGAAVTPPFIAWIMEHWGWRWAFWISAAVGVALAGLWWRVARDRPEQHARVGAAELAVIRGGRGGAERPLAEPWGVVLRDGRVWLLTFGYFFFCYVIYVYLSWFYLYLVRERGFAVLEGAWYAMGPFIAITLFTPLGGWLADRLSGRLGALPGRRRVAMLGLGLTALCIMLGATAVQPLWAVFFLSLGAGWLYFAVTPFWSMAIEIAPGRAGAVAGIMNTGGNLGGVLSPVAIPWLGQYYGWSVALATAAGAALVAAAVWPWLRSRSHG